MCRAMHRSWPRNLTGRTVLNNQIRTPHQEEGTEELSLPETRKDSLHKKESIEEKEPGC